MKMLRMPREKKAAFDNRIVSAAKRRSKDNTIRTPVEERAHIVASLEEERKTLLKAVKMSLREGLIEDAAEIVRAARIYRQVIDTIVQLPAEKWS